MYNNITITHFFFYEKNVSYTSRRALLCRFRVYPATCRGPRCIQTVETPAVIIIFVVGPLAQGVRRGIFLSLSLSHYIYIYTGFVELPLLCAVTRGESRGTAGKNDPRTTRERGEKQ